jgi:hypothetical protein
MRHFTDQPVLGGDQIILPTTAAISQRPSRASDGDGYYCCGESI